MKMLKNNNKMECKDLNIMMNKKIPDIYNYSKKEKAANINIINNILYLKRKGEHDNKCYCANKDVNIS